MRKLEEEGQGEGRLRFGTGKVLADAVVGHTNLTLPRFSPISGRRMRDQDFNRRRTVLVGYPGPRLSGACWSSRSRRGQPIVRGKSSAAAWGRGWTGRDRTSG